MSDVRISLREIIRRSVMGESKLWPIDPKYPADGCFEDRYKAGKGDKRVLSQMSAWQDRLRGLMSIKFSNRLTAKRRNRCLKRCRVENR
jgi:hypothetical protein